MVAPLQVGPFAPQVHRVVDCTVVAAMLIALEVPPSNVKFRLLTVALDWLEFGVPPTAPPEVLVWRIPVVSKLLVVPAMPNWTEAFAESFCSEPPAEGRAPVSAILAVVIIPRMFALAITPVAFPLKLVGVCVCCACWVVAITDKNNIAVILSNIAKKFFFFIIYSLIKNPFIDKFG